MNIQAPLKTPCYEQRLFMVVWLTLIITVTSVMVWDIVIEARNLGMLLGIKLGLYGFLFVMLGLMALWQNRQFQNLYQHLSELGCIEQQWYVLIDGKKQTIELVGEQTLWPWLIRLVYRNDATDQKGSLLIFPSATGDDNFRALSRHLHFS